MLINNMIFYDNTLKPLMDNAKAGMIQLFFVDASHFVMGGFVGVICQGFADMSKQVMEDPSIIYSER